MDETYAEQIFNMPITLNECISYYTSTEESDVTVTLDHKIWTTFGNSAYYNPKITFYL